jgi:hypothetical protein
VHPLHRTLLAAAGGEFLDVDGRAEVNTASLRALLTCGFVSIGAETLLTPAPEVSTPLHGGDTKLEHD